MGQTTESSLELERNRVAIQLAGAVSHKLKQPLAVAWGYLELLRDDPNSSSTQAYLDEIHDALRAMDDIINQLQQVSSYQTRAYAGSLEILDIK